MQSYKSIKNIEIERRIAKKQDKQRGEIPFELEPNTSGKITTLFVKPYGELPFILITPVINDGHEFEVAVAITSITKKDFTINIQSTCEEVVKGTVLWHAEY